MTCPRMKCTMPVAVRLRVADIDISVCFAHVRFYCRTIECLIPPRQKIDMRVLL